MDKTLIDFSQLSAYWPLCYNAECSRKEECIRYQMCRQMPDEKPTYLCVLPSALKEGACRFFKPVRVVRVAKGFKGIFAEVKEKDHASMRRRMAQYLGGGATFYRYRNGVKCLYPEQQEWIRQMFRSYGYTEEVVFDEYQDMYRVDD